MTPNPPQLIEIPLSKIRPNPEQPRKTFDKETIAELAASVKATGQVVPVQVTPSNGGYLLVAGERRLRAAKQAGLKTIQAVVTTIPTEQLRLRALIENLAREDLENEEKEEAIAKEWESGRWQTAAPLARAIGVSDSFVKRIVLAHEIRETEKAVPEGTSAFILGTTAELYRQDKDAARTIWKAAAISDKTGVTGGDKVHNATKIVPKLSTSVRKALADGKIDLDRAEDISRLKTPAEQNHVLQEIVGHRSHSAAAEAAIVEHRSLQSAGKRSPDRHERDVEAETLSAFEDVLWKVKTLTESQVCDLSAQGKADAIRLLKRMDDHLRGVLKDLGAIKELTAGA